MAWLTALATALAVVSALPLLEAVLAWATDCATALAEPAKAPWGEHTGSWPNAHEHLQVCKNQIQLDWLLSAMGLWYSNCSQIALKQPCKQHSQSTMSILAIMLMCPAETAPQTLLGTRNGMNSYTSQHVWQCPAGMACFCNSAACSGRTLFISEVASATLTLLMKAAVWAPRAT